MNNIDSVNAAEALETSVAELVAHVRRATSASGSIGADLLHEQADACLDGLKETARADAILAAVKVHLVAGFAEMRRAMASERDWQEFRTRAGRRDG
jgi:hypothetical protein